MATFSYTSSGKITIKSCTKASLKKFLRYRFPVGAVLYRIDKARKGILEKITVKKVCFVGTIPMYHDTYNAIYGEEDLATHDEAVALAIIYYQNIQDAYNYYLAHNQRC